jgi:hypothetical protein
MIGSILCEIGTMITEKLNEYLDDVIEYRKQNNDLTPPFPYCIFLNTEGFTVDDTFFNVKKPFIYLYVKKIVMDWHTLQSMNANCVLVIDVNDTEPINITDLIDNVYKFCGDTISIIENNDDSHVSIGCLVVNSLIQDDSTSFRYKIEIPINIKLNLYNR